MQNSLICSRITSVYGFQPSSVVFALKTAHFGPEFQVSICPSPHLWFLHLKQRILDQNFNSLRVPTLICGFCMQNSEFWTRITSLYGSQTSSVVLSVQNSDFRTRLTSLYGSQTSSVVSSTHNGVPSTRINKLYGTQPSSVVLCMQNSDFWIRITCLYGSQTWPVVLCMQNSVISTWITSLYGSQPLSVVFACRTASFGPELQVSRGPRLQLSFCAYTMA